VRIADELQVDCPVFYVDNVYEYARVMYPARGEAHLNIADDLPCLLPPFETMWMEWTRFDPGYPPTRMAVRLTTCSLSEAACPWGVAVEGFEQPNGFGMFQSPSRLLIYLNEHGGFVDALDDANPRVPHGGWNWWGHPGGSPGSGLRAILPMWLAVSFMHCKNVRHVETVPKVDHKFLKATGKKPRVRFYTLEIDPMKETLRREGQCETVGLKQALHICRGHFKDYRASGLFGKIKGIFWWDSALRGSPEHGQVIKDYAVKAPTTETVQ
jgi:hypothetical protein